MRKRSLLPILALATAALFALLALGCGDDDSEPASNQPPLELLETAAGKKIDSAEIQLRAGSDIPGFPILGDQLTFTAKGPIAMGADGVPALDWDGKLSAGGQTFPTRITAIDGDVYVDFQGLSYQVEPEMLDMLPFGHGENSAKQGTMSLKSLGIDPSDWLTNAKVEDGEDIGGASTQLITGTVDKQAVLDDVAKAADSPKVQDQIEKSKGAVEGLPELNDETLDKVADAVEKVDVEVNVDSDGYARRVYATLRFKMPESIENAAFEGGEISFELVFDKIGGVTVNVAPPANPRPLSDLLDFAGVIFGVDEPSDLWTSPL
jgi:hypothetical protein